MRRHLRLKDLLISACILAAVGVVEFKIANALDCPGDNCTKGCFVNQSWCAGSGCVTYNTGVAYTGICCPSPSGGTAGKSKMVGWDDYPICIKACPTQNDSTGTCGGAGSTFQPAAFNTACTPAS